MEEWPDANFGSYEGASGHYDENIPPQNRVKDLRRICFYCKQNGHFIAECPAYERWSTGEEFVEPYKETEFCEEEDRACVATLDSKDFVVTSKNKNPDSYLAQEMEDSDTDYDEESDCEVKEISLP